MGSMGSETDREVMIVGGGFGGMYLLHKLRGFGFDAHLYDAGGDFGGTWFWNCYPGARVDSIVPTYQFSSDETWENWQWSEAYPKREELEAYFQHIGKIWDLYPHSSFHSHVQQAHWNVAENKWICQVSRDGAAPFTVKARTVLFCAGLAAVPYTPPFGGSEDFQGKIYHSSRWPREGTNLEGKRCAVIGTGATGIQVIQEVGPVASHLSVFQRTPNTALPMDQATLSQEDNNKVKKAMPDTLELSKATWAGFLYSWNDKSALEVTPEEREQFYEELWKIGGFGFWVGNYKDTSFTQGASDAAYEFWKKKTSPLIEDPYKKEKLCPEQPPNPFGTKRISLYRNFYDVMNLSTVDLIDVNDDPIDRITSQGIKLGSGREIELDVIIFATGFDTVTGGLTHVDIRGSDRSFTLADKWKDGCKTYLGMSTNGFPNFFWVYGPQSPGPFSIGPNCIEYQGTWLSTMLRDLRRDNITTIEATPEAEQKWREGIMAGGEMGLFKYAKSWWFGANIPGKKREVYNYMLGMPEYRKTCAAVRTAGYEGFTLH